jgi:phage baseplate assembly protein W
MSERSFLGRGWAFPPNFVKSSGDVQLVSEEEDIRQSLLIYLNTRRGERLMRLDYGSIASEHVFDSARNERLSSLCERIRNDMRVYEPRILVHNVSCSTEKVSEGIVHFTVDYEVQSTNIRDNIVFPFYLTEGTHVR